MAQDKKILIGADASALKGARKEIDALTQALDRLKKAGIGAPGAAGAKGTDITTASGSAKFTKDIMLASQRMGDLSGKARELMKTMTDVKMKTSAKGMVDAYKDANKELEKLTKTWERYVRMKERSGQPVSEAIRNQMASRMQGASTARVGAGEQLDMFSRMGIDLPGMPKRSLMQRMGGGIRGMFGKLGAMGPAALGGLGGAMGYSLLTGIPRGLHQRYEEQREARTAAAGVFNQRAMQILSGKGHDEAFYRRMGVEQAAQKDMGMQTTRSLLGQGQFAAAMGLGTKKEGSFWKQIGTSIVDYGTAGLAGAASGAALGGIAGAVSGPGALFTAGAGAIGGFGMGVASAAGLKFFGGGGISGMMRDPHAAFKMTSAREYAKSRAANEEQIATLNFVKDQYINKVGAISELQRGGVLGSGAGFLGDLKNAGLGSFAFDQVAGAMNDQYRVGARGVRGTRQGLALQRMYGVEGAAGMSARLGLASGFKGDQTSQLKDVIAEGFAKGMGKGKFKVERQAFVEAMVASTERMGQARYLTGDAARAEAAIVASGLTPGATNLNEIAAAEGARQAIMAQTGSEAGISGALSARAVRRTFGKSKISVAQMGYFQRLGAGQAATDKFALQTITDITGLKGNDAIEFAKKLDKAKGENLLLEAGFKRGQIDDMASGKALTAKDKRAAAAQLLQASPELGTIKRAMQAVSQAQSIVSGTYYGSGKGIGGPRVGVTDAEKLERERAAADLTVLQKARDMYHDIAGAIDDGTTSARNFKEVMKKLGPGEGGMQEITESLDQNLDTITRALGRLATVAGTFPGATPYTPSNQGKKGSQAEGK